MSNLIHTTAERLAGEIGSRPVGTEENEKAQGYLAGVARKLGYKIEELPFDCRRWEFGDSSLRIGSRRVSIHPGPFSPELRGPFPLRVIETPEQLRRETFQGEFLLLRGALAEEPLMPKDFPFYYPEEHKEIVDLLQEKRPAGVIALTGKHPLCGLDPYPLFEDGNLQIPNAYARAEGFPEGDHCEVDLISSSLPSTGNQLVFSREGAAEKRIVLCAHVDTKYETPGALDNAAGVATLLRVMELLADVDLPFSLDLVPFNGEEYYEVSGQLSYLAYRNPSVDNTALVVNLDGLGHRDSANAFSSYNLSEEAESRLDNILHGTGRAVRGDQWIAGDHSMFAFQGIPCVAVTSSNLMETVLGLTHTPADSLEELDTEILEGAAKSVAEILRSWEA